MNLQAASISILVCLSATASSLERFAAQPVWQRSNAGEVGSVPHLPGSMITAIGAVNVSPNGKWLATTIHYSVPGPASGSTMVVLDLADPESYEVVAQTGQPIPGEPGSSWGFLEIIDVNDSGDVAYAGRRAGGVSDSGYVVSRRSGVSTVLARCPSVSIADSSWHHQPHHLALSILNDGRVRWLEWSTSGQSAIFEYASEFVGSVLVKTNGAGIAGLADGVPRVALELAYSSFRSADITGDWSVAAGIADHNQPGSPVPQAFAFIRNGTGWLQSGFAPPSRPNFLLGFQAAWLGHLSTAVSPNGTHWGALGLGPNAGPFVLFPDQVVLGAGEALTKEGGISLPTGFYPPGALSINSEGSWIHEVWSVERGNAWLSNRKFAAALGGDMLDLDGDRVGDLGASLSGTTSGSRFGSLSGDRTYYFASYVDVGSDERVELLLLKTTMPGDVDSNDVVDLDDYFLLADSFRALRGEPAYDVRADFDANGIVDLDDYFVLAENFRRGL